MGSVTTLDATAAITIQPSAIVSKVVHRDETLDVTVFGIDTGEGLTEHTASRTAIVQVVSGRLRFSVEGGEFDAGPGYWIHMAAGTPHSLVAEEPTIMQLTLLRD